MDNGIPALTVDVNKLSPQFYRNKCTKLNL